jgi:hypothetical protein
MTAAPVVETAPPPALMLPYIEQDNVYKVAQQANPNQQQIIAILIGLRQ